MINRVFCYSEQEAKKNRNNISFGKMFFHIIGMTLLLVIVIIVSLSMFDDFMDDSFSIILITFMTLVMWYAVSFGKKMRAQLTGFAIDTNNNVYIVSKLNNGADFVIGGMAAERIIDEILDNNDSLAGDLAKGIGAAMTIYSVNESAKIMQNPEIIVKMVEHATTTTGAEIKQILKVYNYSQDSHKLKIWCDYRIMQTGKIIYNKKITIYKSFNCFNDLMNILLNTRGN